jgi:hypothetical protein
MGYPHRNTIKASFISFWLSTMPRDARLKLARRCGNGTNGNYEITVNRRLGQELAMRLILSSWFLSYFSASSVQVGIWSVSTPSAGEKFCDRPNVVISRMDTLGVSSQRLKSGGVHLPLIACHDQLKSLETNLLGQPATQLQLG